MSNDKITEDCIKRKEKEHKKTCSGYKTYTDFKKFLNSRNGYYLSGPKLIKTSCEFHIEDATFFESDGSGYITVYCQGFSINKNRKKSFLKNLFEKFYLFSPYAKPYRKDVHIFAYVDDERIELSPFTANL